MFTGIVSSIATIQRIDDRGGIRTFELEFVDDFCKDLTIGASVAVDGVCLTVTDQISDTRASFDVVLPSIQITTLGREQVGSLVNVERAAKDGAEIGGHPLSGHIDAQAPVVLIEAIDSNYRLRFGLPESLSSYVFAKGYIAINGASLTVSAVDHQAQWFEVWLIPETRRQTTLGSKLVGDRVNIEIDRGTQVVVDTIKASVAETLGPLLPNFEQFLAAQGSSLNALTHTTAHPLQRS